MPVIAGAMLLLGRTIKDAAELLATSEAGTIAEHLHSIDMSLARIDSHLDTERIT